MLIPAAAVVNLRKARPDSASNFRAKPQKGMRLVEPDQNSDALLVKLT